jgi:hypothetical protein
MQPPDIVKKYRGETPELGWSRHMTGGWRGQAGRMRRWHSRLRTSAPEDRADFLYAFFENAFHLRDWLLDSGEVDAATIDALFASREELRLCRDLANSHKHRSISRHSQPRPPSEVWEYAPAAGNLGGDVSIVIVSNRVKHDALELADKVLATWEEFLEDLRRERAGPASD